MLYTKGAAGFHALNDFTHLGLGSMDLGNLVTAMVGTPAVTSVSPSSGPAGGGTLVTITGSGFSTAPGETQVSFGSIPGSSVSCSSTTSCTATSPTGVGCTTDVSVRVGGISSALSAADHFTYASTGGWMQCLPATSPPYHEAASMAYDEATGMVILFGGCCDSSGKDLNDTWSWNGVTWTQLISPGCTTSCPSSPPARFQASMAYDAHTHSVLLFGGSGACGSTCSDTWSWNGDTWTQQYPPAVPAARFGASMAYDAATGTVLLFGGVTGGGYLFLNDTWSWDDGTWSQLSPVASPSAR